MAMAKKMLEKQRIAICKLEDRVLFDAAGAAEILDAAAAAEAVQNGEAQEADAGDDDSQNNIPAADAPAVQSGASEDGNTAADDTAAVLADSTFLADVLAADDVSETRELVILSEFVKDQDNIISQLDADTDVLVIRSGEDPLDQINNFLDSQSGVEYKAIHVVSHGDAGYFLLNNTVVDAEAVAGDPAAWMAIGEHLTEDGDIMIYGCNVAGSEDGRAMIRSIADLTGADVAASADKVGAANDWSLEFNYGLIESEAVEINGYEYTLNSYLLTDAPSKAGEYGSLNDIFNGNNDKEFVITAKDYTGSYTYGGNKTFSEVDINFSGVNSTDALTFSGTITVNNTLTISGGNIIFAGNTNGNGEIDVTDSQSTVTYSATNANVFAGTYQTLVIANGGTANGDIEVLGDFTISSGTFDFAGNDGVFGGNNTGNITNIASATYNGSSQIFAGEYERLIVNDYEHLLLGNITVTGSTAVNEGASITMYGGGLTLYNATLNGKVSGTGMIQYGTVTYNTDAVLGGTYVSININGDGLTNKVSTLGDLGAMELTLADNIIWNVSGADGMIIGREVVNFLDAGIHLGTGSVITGDCNISIECPAASITGSGTFNMTGGAVVYAVADMTAANLLDVVYDGSYYTLMLQSDSALTVAETLFDSRSMVNFGVDSANDMTINIGESARNLGFYKEGEGNLTLNIADNIYMGGSVLAVSEGSVTVNAGNNVSFAWNISVTGGEMTLTAGSGANLRGKVLSVENGGSLTIDIGGATPGSIQGQLMVSGSGSQLTLAGSNYTVPNYVYAVNNGVLNITGSNISFLNDVLNYAASSGPGGIGYYWTHDYLFSDADYYNYYTFRLGNNGVQVSTPTSPGTITVNAAGKVSFNALVVSGGAFEINSGSVYFNSEFAVAAGTFDITGGEVFFSHSVYVSSIYAGDDTSFTVSGGQVTISGGLYNWVRIPLWYDVANFDPATIRYSGGSFWKDGGGKVHLDAPTSTSSVAFSGNAKVSITGNVSNVGVWGEVFMSIAQSADVTVKGNFNNYASGANFWLGSGLSATVNWDYLTHYMDFSKGFDGIKTYPGRPDFAYFGGYADFVISDTGHLQVQGSTLNGPDMNQSAIGQGYATFDIYSDNNKFNGSFINNSHFSVAGSGNSFGDTVNTFFMYVYNTNNFNSITNSADLQIVNPKAIKLDLTNNGGYVWISGNADGFSFINELKIAGGSVYVDAAFGVDIESDITITKAGQLVFTEMNVLNGSVTVSDGQLTFDANAGGSRLNAPITIGKNGTFNVSTATSAVEFYDDITNSGRFIIDGSVLVDANASITNTADGSITISKTSEIAGDLNNNGTVLVASGALNSVFGFVSNFAGGTFTNAANNTVYNGAFTNNGTFINNNGVSGVRFTNDYFNRGTMKIDGAIAIEGSFSNNSDLYVYGLVDLNTTINNGTIYLEPLTGDHAATVKFGDLTNNGIITSLNDSRNAGDIYFKGKTDGTGSIEGFTGTLYYVYTGTDAINQYFYSNSKYDEVTVYIGNASVTPGNYSKGLVTLQDNMAFKALFLDGGNLAIGDAQHKIIVPASSFTELTAGTITVNAGSELIFGSTVNTGSVHLGSALHNDGTVRSYGDLALNGKTSGSGLVWLAGNKSVSYTDSTDGQALFGFAEGSAANLIIEGGSKLITTDMEVESLTNRVSPISGQGADIVVKKGAVLTLGVINGDANNLPGLFEISTENGGTLNLTSAGTLNADIVNAGTLNISVAGTLVLSASVVNNGGILNAAVGKDSRIEFVNALTVNSGKAELNTTGNGRIDLNSVNNVSGTLALNAADSGVINVNNGISNSGTANLSTSGNGSITAAGMTNAGKLNIAGAKANAVSITGNTVNTGSVSASGVLFGAVDNQGDLSIGSNVAWSSLVNSGKATVAGVLTVTDTANVITSNTGSLIVANGGKLNFNLTSGNAVAIAGTISVSAGAELNVNALGTVTEKVDALPDTTGGLILSGNVINRGTINVPVGGDTLSVLDITGTLDNSDGLLVAENHGRIVLRNGDRLEGVVSRFGDGTIYFMGKLAHLSIMIDTTKTLGEALADITVSAYETLGFTVTGNDTVFTVDENNQPSFSYQVINGAVLLFAGSFTVDGGITADDTATVEVDSGSEIEFAGSTEINGTLKNDGSLEVSASDALIENLENSGDVVVSGDGSVISLIRSNTGAIEASAIGVIEVNEGTITASGNISEVGSNRGEIVADGNIGAVGSNSNLITANGGIGSVDDNAGVIEVLGDGSTLGNVGRNSGVISLDGEGIRLGSILANTGVVDVNGSVSGDSINNDGVVNVDGELTLENFNNNAGGSLNVSGTADIDNISSFGNVTVSGDLSTESLASSGTVRINGTIDAGTIDNIGEMAILGNGSRIGSLKSSGDLSVSGNDTKIDTLDNSGKAVVNGSNSRISIANNRGDFYFYGSGNSIGKLNNWGMTDYYTSNTIDTINNSGIGRIYQNGKLWMMASDEGMDEGLYPSWTNRNFEVLSVLLANDLDATVLDLGTMPSGSMFADVALEEGVFDLSAMGGDMDLLQIDNSINEMIFGNAPDLEEEEYLEVMGENENFKSEVDEALGAIVGK